MRPQETLLLVDDDRHVLSSMAEWLREQGYKTDTAGSLAEGLAATAAFLADEAGMAGPSGTDAPGSDGDDGRAPAVRGRREG